MNFNLKTPCDNCPFRKDRFFYLEPKRALGIAKGLTEDKTFSCHKTTEGKAKEESQCAGALIIHEKQYGNMSNLLFRLAKQFDFYEPSRLDLNAPVYETFDEYVDLLKEKENG